MYCEYCGKKIENDSKFCEYCGKPVSSVTSVSAPRPVAPAPQPKPVSPQPKPEVVVSQPKQKSVVTRVLYAVLAVAIVLPSLAVMLVGIMGDYTKPAEIAAPNYSYTDAGREYSGYSLMLASNTLKEEDLPECYVNYWPGMPQISGLSKYRPMVWAEDDDEKKSGAMLTFGVSLPGLLVSLILIYFAISHRGSSANSKENYYTHRTEYKK